VDKDRIKGKAEQIKGAIKERIGGATKDRSTQGEGFVERQKGKLREGAGKLKDEMRRDDETQHPERTDPEHP
jgi:uncharacterized protein YjbJ (UPF0337 family)